MSCHSWRGPHLASVCKFKDKVCYVCNKRGHIARVCHSRGQSRNQNRRHHIEKDEAESPEDRTYSIFTDTASTPIYQELLINNVPIRMEVDTGVFVSVLILKRVIMEPLQQSNVRLKSYTGEPIPVLGSVCEGQLWPG